MNNDGIQHNGYYVVRTAETSILRYFISDNDYSIDKKKNQVNFNKK